MGHSRDTQVDIVQKDVVIEGKNPKDEIGKDPLTDSILLPNLPRKGGSSVLAALDDKNLLESGVLPHVQMDGAAQNTYCGVFSAPDGKNLLLKDFKTVDADSSGFITAEEIDKYAKSKNLPELTVKDLEEVKRRMGSLEEVSNDEWGDENDGLTIADLETAIKHEQALNYARNRFTVLDKNGDDFVTGDEIDAHMKEMGDKAPPDVLEIGKYLKDNIGDIEEAHDDEAFDENSGFTRHDIIQSAADYGVRI